MSNRTLRRLLGLLLAACVLRDPELAARLLSGLIAAAGVAVAAAVRSTPVLVLLTAAVLWAQHARRHGHLRRSSR